jgi:phage baseplate assembly protein W
VTLKSNRHLAFPFRIGKNGRTVQVSSVAEHIKDEIIQLILTNPSERLFLPEFGGGLRLFVFRNLDEPTIALAKTALTENLLTWLKDRIILEGLELKVENEKLNLKLSYRVKESNESHLLSFQKREG